MNNMVVDGMFMKLALKHLTIIEAGYVLSSCQRRASYASKLLCKWFNGGK
jgi:hypothetical protein